MVVAILAVVSAAIGLASGVIGNNSASLQAMLHANQASVDFAREKELADYNAYQSLIFGLIALIVLGVIIFAIAIYQK